ncbi:cell filamentation protein Fic [Cellulosimicrobium sp. BIT-GX5]|uniref:protein adenylyltransferase n=1 Tax=Cellulosimicrobium composti TaxID=2672572 RepID=A0A6N7ZMX8_9MICO|nr:cell filamentation protein Fic [Cellulosimicrobium composti]
MRQDREEEHADQRRGARPARRRCPAHPTQHPARGRTHQRRRSRDSGQVRPRRDRRRGTDATDDRARQRPGRSQPLTERPWESGDEQARWDGYLLADGRTLRNRVGATTPEMLREREDRRVEARALTLREHGLPATYDLAGLRAIHRHLFQDVYDWAGDVRTVSIRKSRDGWFAPLDRIEDAMDAVATYLRDTDNLRTLDPSAVPGALASVYDVVNQTHPFREGNGRVQREFITALARESGHRLDWTRVTLGRPGYESENDQASRLARTGDRGPLRAMFARITTKAGAIDDHVNDALRLVAASRPPSTARPSATAPAVARVNRPAPGAPGRDYGR